jgi:glycosyltransferase involved in cell wall biosynthesis
LNIDPDETVIAFGAMALNNPYKGWEYLKSALEILKSSFELVKISALIFGSNHNQQIANTIPFKTKFMGYLKDEYISALVYNAADVFVAPSLADNLPFTVLESLACGTPVTAFRTGGIPDMVIHKKNGYLADYKDAKDLAEGIKFCINEQLSGYLAEQFNSDEIIKKHKELINEVTL